MSKIRPSQALEQGKKVKQNAEKTKDEINYNNLSPAFRFSDIQKDYCLSKWNDKEQKSLIDCLQKMETKNWNEILHYGGRPLFGYKKTNKDGIIPNIPENITKDTNIYYFQPKGSNTSYRIFGYREGHNFCFLWFDRKHEVYPGDYK